MLRRYLKISRQIERRNSGKTIRQTWITTLLKRMKRECAILPIKGSKSRELVGWAAYRLFLFEIAA